MDLGNSVAYISYRFYNRLAIHNAPVKTLDCFIPLLCVMPSNKAIILFWVNLLRLPSKTKVNHIQLRRAVHCKSHSKDWVHWRDPCVKKRIPNFFRRIEHVADLVGMEARITSLHKIHILQTKEKWGSTHVYYTSMRKIPYVLEGQVQGSPVWLAQEEGLLDYPADKIPQDHDHLESIAISLLREYRNKPLPKTGRIYFGLERKTKSAKYSYETAKPIWKAMKRQRRLNPELAHFIFNFAPYDCDCKDDFWCEEYAHVNPIQKLWDKIVVGFLETSIRIDNLRWKFKR